MKALFVLLVLSLLTVMAAVWAMWLRARRHLRQSDEALRSALEELERRQEEAATRPDP